MRKSKFFELLLTFNKKQIQKLSKIIQVNEEENLLLLFKYLSRFFIDDADETLLSREYILKHLYDNKISDKQLQKLLNEGVKLCEWIIIQQNIEGDKNQQHLILSSYYQKHKLSKYFSQQINLFKEEILLNKDMGSSYYYLYQLEYLTIEQELLSNLRKINYSNLNSYLNTFYEIEQLKIKCVTITNLNKDLELLPINSILYQQYQNCYTLLVTESAAEYVKFWNMLVAEAEKIGEEDLKTLVNMYYNFCISQLNKNNTIFYRYLLDAYLFSLENNILFEENGLLLPSHFKNIITISLRLDKIDFAFDFANQYKYYLPEENREDVFNYNMAHIYFFQHKYEDVLTLLVQSKFTDVFYKLSSRVLQIKTYAELTLSNNGFDDVLESCLNAFKKFIYTNKEISENYASNYKNFYKVMNKILSLTKEDAASYLEEIRQLKPLTENEWLVLFLNRKLK